MPFRFDTPLGWGLSWLLLVGAWPTVAPAQVLELPASNASGDDTILMEVPGSMEPNHLGEIIADPDFDYWAWQVAPNGLMFRSYLAGGREPRIGGAWMRGHDQGWLWNITLGGRAALLRYGTEDPAWPEGIELDIEGAAFPRLAFDEGRDVVASDFRFGLPLTFRRGIWEGKFAFYHLSSHLGDEYIESHPAVTRINYSRDVLLLALAMRPTTSLRLYAEAGWAYYAHEGSEPWEFQFGIEYSSMWPSTVRGAPFFAINSRLRQEVDFGGNMAVEAGWQWRGESGRLMRLGMRYFNGMSDSYQFVDEHEQLIGMGLWYDF